MTRWLAFVLMGGALIGALGVERRIRADDSAKPADSQSIEEAVQRQILKLNGATRNERSAAERQLIELGPAILPHLPNAESLPTNSVREAVRRIRQQLERKLANDSVAGAMVAVPSQVSVREAIATISEQSKNLLDTQKVAPNMLERALDREIKRQTFWQAVDELSGRYSIQFEHDSGQHALRFFKSPEGWRPDNIAVAYSGAFRIDIPPVEIIRRGMRGGFVMNHKQGQILRITPRIRPEPRLRTLFLQLAMNDFDVTTASGKVLVPFSPEASYELKLNETTGQSPIQLDYLAGEEFDGGPLAIRGKMTCMTAAGREEFRFPIDPTGDPQKGAVSRRRGSVTVELVKFDRTKQELRIQIRVTYDTGGPAFESHRRWWLHEEAYLEGGGESRRKPNDGIEALEQEDRGGLIEFRYTDLPESDAPLTFVYVAPTMIIDVPIAFEIKSLSVLPREATGKPKP